MIFSSLPANPVKETRVSVAFVLFLVRLFAWSAGRWYVISWNLMLSKIILILILDKLLSCLLFILHYVCMCVRALQRYGRQGNVHISHIN